MADTDLFRGHEGVRRGIETWLESWRDFRFDPREVLERGDRERLRRTHDVFVI
jgi:hypothetical protein